MTLDRRTLLRGAAAAGAVAVVAPVLTDDADAGTTWVVPLLQRATYGATPASVAAARRLGSPQAWVEQQLAPARLPDPDGDTVRALYPHLGWSISKTRASLAANSFDAMLALGYGTVGLAAWSSRQLLERMVEMWSNHLNVPNPSERAWDSRADYDRTVIRHFALGRFSDMLLASARHPAMLGYLDQAESTKDAPNENYARELLELHTVGVGAGYTEAMVRDSARILTGWGIDDNGHAVYRSNQHATGAVHVLGFRHANRSADGRAVATAYLRYLARHPRTAQRIAHRLAVRFVSDAPPKALVDALAKTYLAHDTDIRPVLRRLLLGPEWRRGRKLKTPYEDLVSSVRVLGLKPLPPSAALQRRRSGPETLYWRLQGVRHTPLSWPLPDGYPDVATAFQAADVTLGRWNNHMALAAAWSPKRNQLSMPPSRALLPRTLPTTYGGLVDNLCDRLLQRRLDPTSRLALVRFCGVSDPHTRLRSNSPWLDWRLPYLVALVLSTPAFAERS